MGLGLADLYQKNIPESSRVQLYTRGEAGSGYPWGTNSLLLARVSNAIILSCRSYALWIPRWVSTLRPLSYLPVCTLLNGGLQVPHCFSVGFVTFALTFDVMQAARKSETVQGRKWIGIYLFFLCCVFFIKLSLFSTFYLICGLLFLDIFAYVCMHVCMCICMYWYKHMEAQGWCWGSSSVALCLVHWGLLTELRAHWFD